MSTARDISLSVFDYWRYAPEREQYKSDEHIQNSTYRLTLFFSYLGITSNRWEMLTKQNKLENIGQE